MAIYKSKRFIVERFIIEMLSKLFENSMLGSLLLKAASIFDSSIFDPYSATERKVTEQMERSNEIHPKS